MQEASLDAYDAMPVSAFGEAMMRGMGWKEGMSVGKNAPKEVRDEAAYCSGPGNCNTTRVQYCCSAQAGSEDVSLLLVHGRECESDWACVLQEVKAKEYVARPSMLGLGAKPSEILQRPPKQHIRQVGDPLSERLYPKV